MIRRTLLVLMCSLITMSANAQAPDQSDVPNNDPIPHTAENHPFDIYCDFRCPFCAKLFITLFSGSTIEGRAVSFRFLHFPLHQGSDTLARLYESAILNYPEKSDLLIESLYKYREQTSASNHEKIIAALSVVHGMDLDLIKRDMKARDIAFAISASKQSAVAKRVIATPTVFHGLVQLPDAEPEKIARYILENSPRKLGQDSAPVTQETDCSSCTILRRAQ